MQPILAEVTPGHTALILLPGQYQAFDTSDLYLLRTLTPLIKPVSPQHHALTMPLSWPAVVQLGQTFGQRLRPGARLSAWMHDQVIRRVPAEDLPVAPPGLADDIQPYPWQLAGGGMIAAMGGALINDEPGTGKTGTALLGLAMRAKEIGADTVFPALVVCPASVIDSWLAAVRGWFPGWSVAAWRGPDRLALGQHDVMVTSYDTARNDDKVLLREGFRSIVIDEHHYIKNPTAHRTKTVLALAKKTEQVIALSGTPITHHPGDLHPMLQALVPGAWPSRSRFIQHYCQLAPMPYGGDKILGLAPHRDAEFRRALRGQMRRVAKADVLADLPTKVYSTREVVMPAAWRRAYDAMARDMLAELPGGGELSTMSVLAQLTRLSQMASAATDITTVPSDDAGQPDTVTVRLRAPSWKIDALLDILAEREGQPVVAFALHRDLVRLAAEAAAAAGRRVRVIIGGQTAAARTTAIEDFQAGRADVIVATVSAGGVGITLTAAGTAVFLQRPWSLTDSIQAEDRIHRIGSTHESVEIIDIVTKDTVEDKVRKALRDKAKQFSDLVADPRVVAELLGGAR